LPGLLWEHLKCKTKLPVVWDRKDVKKNNKKINQ